MLMTCFRQVQSPAGYTGISFQQLYPKQARIHPCHVHVGGRIRMAIITPKEGYKELSEDEVKSINIENAKLNQSLREFFLKGGAK